MGAVRFICLSDLHLGSSRSLLSSPDPADDADEASTVLKALVECLRSLADADAPAKPVLVLNGDILEFALASDEVSASAFESFMELVMRPGEELFEQVWYLPGNHDHHLWEAARETQFSEWLTRHASEKIPHPWFSTLMLRESEPHPVASPLLTTLLRRAQGVGEPASFASGTPLPFVSASYPNLALLRGERCVVFHHGHYIEWPYRLLTTLNTKLFGAPEPANVSELEEGNFAWIDFVWSALGRTGDPGESVQYVYDHLTTEEGRADLVERISHNLALAIHNRTNWAGLEDALQERTVAAILGLVSEWGGAFGRQAYYGGATAVKAHDAGLTTYLERYVREQIARECAGCEPSDVTFVFGHTHHPLVRRGHPCRGFSAPVRVYNTGGWVHETSDLQPQIGATLVLLDDALDSVAIEIYRELPTLASRYPRVQSATDGDSNLAARVRSRLSEDAGPWRELTRAIAERIERSAPPATAARTIAE